MRSSWPVGVIVLAVLLFGVSLPRTVEACKGCKPPTLARLAKDASRVVAGEVESTKREHSVIAVSATWKGTKAPTVERDGCRRLLKRVGAKVIVLEFPKGYRNKFISECLGVYSDTPATRAELARLFPAPTSP